MQFINSKEAGAYVTAALDLIQQHLSWPVLIVMFLMGCAGLVVLFLLFKKYGSRIKIVEGLTMDTPADPASSAELIMFSTDWCPHCKVAKPEWEKLVDDYEGQLINGKTVVFTQYNCTTETPEITALIAKYGVKGYPTVKLLTNGQVIDFDAKPTEDSLLQFLKASL
jgi:thiol-disulfide isomerase/thioredoxin